MCCMQEKVCICSWRSEHKLKWYADGPQCSSEMQQPGHWLRYRKRSGRVGLGTLSVSIPVFRLVNNDHDCLRPGYSCLQHGAFDDHNVRLHIAN